MADPQLQQTVEYQWAYSIMDSSRVSTFLISMLLIVYGSFRSLNMEQEARERAAQSAPGSTNCLLNPGVQAPVTAENTVQTLDTVQALCLPLGASISLLVMFFFFDSMQMLFAICTASKFTTCLRIQFYTVELADGKQTIKFIQRLFCFYKFLCNKS